MATKKPACFFLILFFFLPLALTAQDNPAVPGVEEDTFVVGTSLEEDASAYYFVETEGGIQFIQRIEWEAMDFVYRYELIVEQKTFLPNSSIPVFREILRESVEENFAEISVPAGDYRYKILVYNLLDKQEGESDWEEFNVFLAVQPQLEGFSPRNYYLDETEERVLVLSGDGFVPGGQVFLVPQATTAETSFFDRLRGMGRSTRIIPREIRISDDGTEIHVFFAEADLLSGVYDVWVQNPGGLYSLLGSFNIAFQKPVDWNFSIVYTPLVMLYGSTFKEYLETQADFGPFFPVGFTARISFVPIKQVFGYFGLELAPFWGFISRSVDAYGDGNAHIQYDVKTHVLGVHLNFLYQKPLIPKKLVLNARVGGGVHSFMKMRLEYPNNIVAPDFKTWFVSAGGGASLQWFLRKQLFLDVSLEYKHFFVPGMPLGFLFPGISVGWQL